jgi:tRNA(Ile)-lysidine synthase
VATFDHRSGAHGERAVAVVRAVADMHGLACEVGRADEPLPGASEAAWRAARWRFLRHAASRAGASVVVTGHTWDDQVETVCMRILRGAGARGLAALAADTGVARPLLEVRRDDTAAYARACALPVVEDPTNTDRRSLRARVRFDLLPALERVRPGFREALWAIGADAAGWRASAEAWAGTIAVRRVSPSELAVSVAEVCRLSPAELAVLWPALLGRHGIVLDRRGTERLAGFTTGGVSGQEIQLAGGIRVHRTRASLVVSADRPRDDAEP